MIICGGCHCGAITFKLDWQPEPDAIPARACSCTFCRKHGGVWTSCPGGRLAVSIRTPTRVSRYRFGTQTADFHVCPACGVVPVVTSAIGGRIYAVVNVNAFENVPASLLRRADANFDAEDEHVRLARRASNWIPDVVFSERGD